MAEPLTDEEPRGRRFAITATSPRATEDAHMGTASGARLAFVDCETTGLDPDRHEVWEVGMILREVGGTASGEVGFRWLLPVTRLGDADPVALRIGQFHKRHPQGYQADNDDHPERKLTELATFARAFGELTHEATLVGAVVSFDEERLRKLLKANGVLPTWHYHLCDVEALVAGRYGLAPPWDSTALSMRAGVNPSTYERHTALGDAKWARDLYDAVMGDPAEPTDDTGRGFGW